MSYLKLPPSLTLDLSRATISLWFRVPRSTVDTVEVISNVGDFYVFDGVIPLLVLGTQKQGTVTHFATQIVGYGLEPAPGGGPPTITRPIYSNVPVGTYPGQMAPSFIGIDTSGHLSIHLQTGDVGSSSQINFVISRYNLATTDDGFYETVTYTDTSADEFPFPDCLGNDGMPTNWGGPQASKHIEVAFDAWHHLLLSWDVGGGNASHGLLEFPTFDPPNLDEIYLYVDAVSKLYCAVDDINRTGVDLPAIWYPGMGPNDTISYATGQIAGLYMQTDPAGPYPGGGGEQIGGPTATPQYSVSFASGVRADGVYIPSELEYRISYAPELGGPDKTNPNKAVELAELQIFAGLAIDTGNETYRRAFIDSDGKPVDPAEAEKVMGKPPDILLHGTGNWIAGRNTGALGLISAGQFTPTGKIDPYSPDPSLHGPQGSAA